VPRFEFLGRIESFDADMRLLGERLNLPEGWVESVLNGSQTNPENNQSYRLLNVESAKFTRTSGKGRSTELECAVSRGQIVPTIVCRLCRLYALDYKCLGPDFYRVPPECDACGDVVEVSSAVPRNLEPA
jgi:hypothetical protein